MTSDDEHDVVYPSMYPSAHSTDTDASKDATNTANVDSEPQDTPNVNTADGNDDDHNGGDHNDGRSSSQLKYKNSFSTDGKLDADGGDSDDQQNQQDEVVVEVVADPDANVDEATKPKLTGIDRFRKAGRKVAIMNTIVSDWKELSLAEKIDKKFEDAMNAIETMPPEESKDWSTIFWLVFVILLLTSLTFFIVASIVGLLSQNNVYVIFSIVTAGVAVLIAFAAAACACIAGYIMLKGKKPPKVKEREETDEELNNWMRKNTMKRLKIKKIDVAKNTDDQEESDTPLSMRGIEPDVSTERLDHDENTTTENSEKVAATSETTA